MPATPRPAEAFQHGQFNVDALRSLATSLRNGIDCYCDTSQIPLAGSLNLAIALHFTDGVEWLMRSPRNRDGAILCPETNSLLLESEAATLRYIKAHTSIPVPEVFSYSPSAKNEIGVPYILMSKATGIPLEDRWASLSLEEKEKVLRQLGSFQRELCQLRFDQIGSLFDTAEGPVIKSCLARGLLVHERHSLDLQRGPFTSSAAFYEALFSACREHAEVLLLTPRCFLAPPPLPGEYETRQQFELARDRWHDFVALGSKLDGSDNRTDFIIASDILAELHQKCMDGLCVDDDKYGYCLSHPDISVNNIFVDEECNISCIIDWAFCSTVPPSMALLVPGLPQSRYELPELLQEEYKTGFKNALSGMRVDFREADLLHRVVQHNRPMWFLSRLLSVDTIVDYHLLYDMWILITPNCTDGLLEEFQKRQAQDRYTCLHARIKEEDDPSDIAERKYFARRQQIDLTVARKLTLVSEWSLRYGSPRSSSLRMASTSVFLADRKLWSWIDQFLVAYNGQP